MRSKLNIKEKLSHQAKTSVILFAFKTAATWLYLNLAHGIFGRFFTAYEREEECFEGSVTGFIAGSHPGKKTLIRRMRRRFAAAFENSLLLSALGRVPGYMLSLGMRVYSTFFIVFGFYSVAMALLKRVITGEAVNDNAIICGGILVIIAIPLALIKRSLAQVLREASISRLILIRLLRIHEDKLYPPGDKENVRYSMALVLGMVLGALTYFVEPTALIAAVAMLVLVWVVLSLPEVGIMALLSAVPFLSIFKHPTLLLACGVLLTTVSYFIKYLRGKRTMRFGLVGVFVSLFSVMILLGGIVSVGGKASLSSALVYFILLQGFNLIVNLFRTRDDCRHALTVLAVSGGIAGLYGVIQYLLGNATADWLDTEMFAYIEGRATSFFDNPNVFGAYLIAILPLLLLMMIYSAGIKKKFLSMFSALVSIVALVWTWSRGAWLGAIFGIVVFFLIFSYKTLQVLLAGGLCLPLVGSFLPQDVVSRFLSIGNMSDSSTYYRVYTWRGVGRMLERVWASGIGVGSAAFEQVYPLFAYVGIEATPHAHNLIMQVLCETGIAGALTFAIIMILFVQNCFGAIVKHSGKQRMTVAAGLCGILSMLVMGLADNIWYNYRVFFVFWSIMALTVAYINALRSEDRDVHEEMSPESAQVGVNIIE